MDEEKDVEGNQALGCPGLNGEEVGSDDLIDVRPDESVPVSMPFPAGRRRCDRSPTSCSRGRIEGRVRRPWAECGEREARRSAVQWESGALLQDLEAIPASRVHPLQDRAGSGAA